MTNVLAWSCVVVLLALMVLISGCGGGDPEPRDNTIEKQIRLPSGGQVQP